MRALLFIALVSIFTPTLAPSQNIDTTRIMNQINALKENGAKKKALHRIIEEDQAFRGAQTNDSLDLLHLVWISFFVNTFGYPDKELFGDDAFGASIVWIHNHRRLRSISFPIIRKGFLAGQIKEKDLRGYYLRTMYTHQFDDEEYLHLPIRELFKKLDINTTDHIPVEALLKAGAEIAEDKAQVRTVLGTWTAEGLTKTYDVEGRKVDVNFEGQRVELFKMENGKVFLGFFSYDGSIEPQEMFLSGESNYRFKNLKTSKYYRIKGDELVLMDGGRAIRQYHKTTDR